MTTSSGPGCSGDCTRCLGKGMRDCVRAHLGVSGLCFDCDGDGTAATQARRRAEAKAAKAAKAYEDRCRAAEAHVKALRDAYGIGRPLPWAKRRFGTFGGTFTTEAYCAAFDLSAEDGLRELACSYPTYGSVFDAEGRWVGWTYG